MPIDPASKPTSGRLKALSLAALMALVLIPTEGASREETVRKIQPAAKGPNWVPVDIPLLGMAGSRARPALSRL